MNNVNIKTDSEKSARSMAALLESLVNDIQALKTSMSPSVAYSDLLRRIDESQADIAALKEFILSFVQDLQWNKYKTQPLMLDEVLKAASGTLVAGPLNQWWITKRNNHLPLLFGGRNLLAPGEGNLDKADIFYFWGAWQSCREMMPIATAAKDKPLFFIEDGFLKSILTSGIEGEPRFHSGVCFTVDDLGFHFDATRPSRLECMLNSPQLEVAAQERSRARRLMRTLVENKLTKYNHQTFELPEVGRPGRTKVLVIEQAYNDYSILKGLADTQTFVDMLQAASNENPDADILVKVHPDTLAGHRGHSSYYSGIRQQGNIFPISFSCNPFSLLELVDKVYVVSSQLGFEALMAGKEVHVFGMPFYAGWGMTHDRQTCPRRTRTRTLEEIFFITYILYSVYVDPKQKTTCTIEKAIDYILALREEYFSA